MQRSILFLVLLTVIDSCLAKETTLNLAVSTSISSPLERICKKFSQETKFKCKITTAPTGHLYAHVMHGMSYDLFISTDETYTAGLISAQKALLDTRQVIATGRIVLWSAKEDLTAQDLNFALIHEPSTSVVIANPGVSSYGAATKEALVAYNLWHAIQGRIVYSKNIKQSYDLLSKKRVALGFVSLAQLSMQERQKKHFWEPDPKTYKPVIHEAIMLSTVQNEGAASAFMAYLKGASSCEVFEEAGYRCHRA